MAEVSLKCAICGDDLTGQPVVVIDQQVMHRFWTRCKRTNQALREELQRLIAERAAVAKPNEPHP